MGTRLPHVGLVVSLTHCWDPRPAATAALVLSPACLWRTSLLAGQSLSFQKVLAAVQKLMKVLCARIIQDVSGLHQMMACAVLLPVASGSLAAIHHRSSQMISFAKIMPAALTLHPWMVCAAQSQLESDSLVVM